MKPGGKELASPVGMTDAEIIQSERREGERRADDEEPVHGESRGGPPHVSSPLLEAELDERRDEDHGEEDERDRGAAPHVPEPEAFLVHEERHRERRVQRAARRHDVRLGEELEVVDRAREADEEHRRREERQRDPPELLPAAGPVEARGLVEGLRDPLQARDEEDRREPEVLPDREDHDRDEREARVAEPVHGREPDQREPAVQEAEARVVDVLEDDRDGDERRDDGREERRPEKALEARDARVHEERRRERDGDRERAREEDEDERVPERRQEDGVRDERAVVREARHARVRRVRERVEVEVRRGEEERGRDREEEEDDDHEEARREEEERRADFRRRPAADLSAHGPPSSRGPSGAW